MSQRRTWSGSGRTSMTWTSLTVHSSSNSLVETRESSPAFPTELAGTSTCRYSLELQPVATRCICHSIKTRKRQRRTSWLLSACAVRLTTMEELKITVQRLNRPRTSPPTSATMLTTRMRTGIVRRWTLSVWIGVHTRSSSLEGTATSTLLNLTRIQMRRSKLLQSLTMQIRIGTCASWPQTTRLMRGSQLMSMRPKTIEEFVCSN